MLNLKRKLSLGPAELNLRNTFLNGQCFHWQEINDKFAGLVGTHLVIVRRNNPSEIEFQEFPQNQFFQEQFKQYLNLGQSISALYREWSKQQHFKPLGLKYPGIRCLRQDPWQCTISFICSTNNNIKRITSSLENLRKQYGTPICKNPLTNLTVHSFPTLQQLRKATEQQLRQIGLGYRARYIFQSLKIIQQNGGQVWLRNMRGQTHQNILNSLMQLKGVGRKVADCIALFSMDCFNAVPIDTHMRQIAQKFKLTQKVKQKSLSKKQYKRVTQSFQEKFKPRAGWAHQILFLSELEDDSEILVRQLKSK